MPFGRHLESDLLWINKDFADRYVIYVSGVTFAGRIGVTKDWGTKDWVTKDCGRLRIGVEDWEYAGLGAMCLVC